jgi:hypothetical protein
MELRLQAFHDKVSDVILIDLNVKIHGAEGTYSLLEKGRRGLSSAKLACAPQELSSFHR